MLSSCFGFAELKQNCSFSANQPCFEILVVHYGCRLNSRGSKLALCFVMKCYRQRKFPLFLLEDFINQYEVFRYYSCQLRTWL